MHFQRVPLFSTKKKIGQQANKSLFFLKRSSWKSIPVLALGSVLFLVLKMGIASKNQIYRTFPMQPFIAEACVWLKNCTISNYNIIWPLGHPVCTLFICNCFCMSWKWTVYFLQIGGISLFDKTSPDLTNLWEQLIIINEKFQFTFYNIPNKKGRKYGR